MAPSVPAFLSHLAFWSKIISLRSTIPLQLSRLWVGCALLRNGAVLVPASLSSEVSSFLLSLLHP